MLVKEVSKWYVSLENRIGQVTTQSFDCKRVFDSCYSREVFPEIHYQGPNQQECWEVTREIMIPRVMILELLSAWALAPVDLEAAVLKYQQLKDGGVIPT